MAIDVTVTESCNRCKRKEQVTISSDKVGEFEARHDQHVANKSTVDDFVRENEGKLPDLVVIFKGKVQMLSKVCDAYCTKTVQNGVDTLFREHKVRKPRRQMTEEEKAAAKVAKDAQAATKTAKEAKEAAVKDKKKK